MMCGTCFSLCREVVFLVMLIIIACVDWKKRIVPNWLLLAGVVNWAAWTYVRDEVCMETLQAVLISVIIPVCVLGLVLLLEKKKGRLMMGGGDVKLMFIMALYFDWYRLLHVLFVTCLAGLLLAWYSLKRAEGGVGEKKVPLGPCFVIGVMWGICKGEPLCSGLWYLLKNAW